MKRFFLMAAMTVSLIACDHTKMKLRAPAPDQSNAIAKTAAADSLTKDSIQTDTTIAVTAH